MTAPATSVIDPTRPIGIRARTPSLYFKTKDLAGVGNPRGLLVELPVIQLLDGCSPVSLKVNWLNIHFSQNLVADTAKIGRRTYKIKPIGVNSEDGAERKILNPGIVEFVQLLQIQR